MQGPKTSSSSQDSNVTLVLVIVVLVFTVCQTPALATQLMWSLLGDDARLCGGLQFYFGRVSNLLVVVNSAANFHVYLFFNTRFRLVLAQMVGWRLDVDGPLSGAAGGGSRAAGAAAGAATATTTVRISGASAASAAARPRRDENHLHHHRPQNQQQLQPLLSIDSDKLFEGHGTDSADTTVL